MRLSKSGFTIVELLIVIVVIAILAAISVVAYRGIQNRANDTTVKADLNNFAKLIEIQKVNLGAYPATLTSGMGFKFSKNAYGRDYQDTNLRYCRNATTDSYVLMANSRSGNFYSVSNGLVSNTFLDPYSSYGWGVCAIVGLVETNPTQNGYNNATYYTSEPQGWTPWVN